MGSMIQHSRAQAIGSAVSETPVSHMTEPLRAELVAMQAIGDALARVPDQEGRTRVLRWATELFKVSVAAPSPDAMPQPEPANPLADSGLAVTDLEEMFQMRPRRSPDAESVWAPKPLSLVKPAEVGAGTELTDAEVEELFAMGPRSTEEAPAPSTQEAPAHSAVVTDQPVVSMLNGFVADFQQLARDWAQA